MAIVGQANVARGEDSDHFAAVVFHQQAIGFDRFGPLAIVDIGLGTLEVGADRVVDLVELDRAGELELARGWAKADGGTGRRAATVSRPAEPAGRADRQRAGSRPSRGRLSSSEQSLAV